MPFKQSHPASFRTLLYCTRMQIVSINVNVSVPEQQDGQAGAQGPLSLPEPQPVHLAVQEQIHEHLFAKGAMDSPRVSPRSSDAPAYNDIPCLYSRTARLKYMQQQLMRDAGLYIPRPTLLIGACMASCHEDFCLRASAVFANTAEAREQKSSWELAIHAPIKSVGLGRCCVGGRGLGQSVTG